MDLGLFCLQTPSTTWQDLAEVCNIRRHTHHNGYNMFSWIDTHCHLDAAEFAADRSAVLLRAREAGVSTLVVPAVTAGNFAEVAALAAADARIWPAFGMHPIYIADHLDSHLDILRQTLRQHRPVAVGEIGLDYFVPGLDYARQEWLFLEQLKLAREYDLPVLLHIRRSQDQVLKCLRKVRVKGGIAHAFNGSLQQADAFIKLGFCLGFGGAMTFPRALRIRALATQLPAEALVLETDAPDIPPEFAHRQRNEPAYLPRIAETMATLRGWSLQLLATTTTDNARKILSHNQPE